jgi:DNA-binding GntR family transcriptional regulator
MDTLKLVQSTSLSLLVQQEITRLILSGEIAAGEWLNESALSQRFGVSRGPVREAFRSLEEMGFLRQEKNRGSFVREITAAEADQIYELREVLDELIARKAAAVATQEQIATLRATLDDMKRAVSEMNVATYYPINLRFHDLLAEYAGNPKLIAICRRLMNELHIFGCAAWESPAASKNLFTNTERSLRRSKHEMSMLLRRQPKCTSSQAVAACPKRRPIDDGPLSSRNALTI